MPSIVTLLGNTSGYLITISRQIEGAGTPRPRYHTGLTTKEQHADAHQSISLDQQAGQLMRPASTHRVILGSPTSPLLEQLGQLTHTGQPR